MGKTSIQWTDRSVNPIRARHKVTGKVGWHCMKISKGCSNCYAEAINKRFGTKLPYTLRSLDEVELFFDPKQMDAVIRHRKPEKWFVCDQTDLFGEFVPFEYIDQVFAYMAMAKDQTFQVLTKRPERAFNYMQHAFETRPCIICIEFFREGARVETSHTHSFSWPLPNVWIGTSVENQEQADKRISSLVQIPAAVQFLSVEPLLGSVLLPPWFLHQDSETPRRWVIIGGESGSRARACDISWIRSIRDQCRAAGVAAFVKQLGSRPMDYNAPPGKLAMILDDSKGGDWSEWPEDLRIRQWPVTDGQKTLFE